MTRYEDFVNREAKGVTFEPTKRRSCEQLDKACNIKADDNSANYANPPIPEGFAYITGKWNTGLVIEGIVSGSQYVWVPVGSLDANGTIDGKNFSEKFGRRNYMKDEFSEDCFIDPLDNEEFQKQIESVEKYGGFYISRYNISLNVCGRAESRRTALPCIGKSIYEAKELAESIENTELVKSHLVYGAEYDSVLEWFIHSKVLRYNEIVDNSILWGNYKNTFDYTQSTKIMLVTGRNESWVINNIADLAGNVSEWTQETVNGSQYVVRGGSFFDYSSTKPVAYRQFVADDCISVCWGFRAALYIK